MDTAALAGINATGAQMPQISAAEPVAVVKAVSSSPSSNSHSHATLNNEHQHSENSGELNNAASEATMKLLSDGLAENTRLSIDRDESTGKVVFKTIDRSSGEIIRQVPSEEMLTLSKSLRSAKGLLISKEA